MKIVIDIDEKDYNFIKSVKSIMKNSDTYHRISTDLFRAVKDVEVVYPMSVAPITENKNTDMQWSIQVPKDKESIEE